MPCRYVIDTELRLVITTASDPLTFAEVKAHQDQLRNDPHFLPEFNQLLDGTGLTRIDISAAEAQTIARGSLFFSPSSRRAWVASDPVIFGVGRMIEAYRELAGAKEEFHVFHDRDAALKWLSLPAGQE